jgi:hypothetical protein
MLASYTGNPSPDPARAAFSCAQSTPGGGVCNAMCIYGKRQGKAPHVATCTDGVWNVSGGMCAFAPFALPMFATLSIGWTWFMTGSCNANVTYALETAMRADLQTLLVKMGHNGTLSVALSSCTTDLVRVVVCKIGCCSQVLCSIYDALHPVQAKVCASLLDHLASSLQGPLTVRAANVKIVEICLRICPPVIMTTKV